MANLQNFKKTGAIVKIVTVLPNLEDAENGELFFLTSDSKLYIRVTEGWLKTSALS